MRTLIIFLFISAFAPRLFSQDLKTNRELRVDLNQATGMTASEVFEEVEYIPLETSDKSLFGSITQLFVTDDFFIIRDKDTKSILFFLKNGRFDHKIDIKKYADSKIQLDESKKRILLINSENEHIFINYNGEVLNTFNPAFGNYFHIFPNNKVVYVKYGSADFRPDSVGYGITIADNNRIIKEFLPFHLRKFPVKYGDVIANNYGRFYATGNDTSVFYCRPYDYSIYKITPNNVTREFKFIFSKDNTLPANFSTDTASFKRLDFVWKNKSIVDNIWFPYLLGNTLFFYANRTESPSHSYAYNLESATLISLRYIQPDQRTFFLPVTDLNIGVEFANSNFYTSDGIYVYTSISSAKMFRFYDESKEKKPEYSAPLLKYFSSGDRKDNPVIVRMKPRETF